MDNVANPAENNGQQPIVANPENGGTPPTPPAAAPTNNAEIVTLTKEEHDQLRKDAARASSNQRKASLYDKLYGSNNKGHFTSEPPKPLSEEEKIEIGRQEDKKAERGLISIAANPEFREALDADPTLRNMLINNPLAVLPMIAPEAIDAEDAISIVTEKLKDRVEEIKKSKTILTAAPVANKDNQTVPPTGGINPPATTTPDAEYENAKKNPNTESAIANMVKIGLNKLGGK